MIVDVPKNQCIRSFYVSHLVDETLQTAESMLSLYNLLDTQSLDKAVYVSVSHYALCILSSESEIAVRLATISWSHEQFTVVIPWPDEDSPWPNSRIQCRVSTPDAVVDILVRVSILQVH